MRRRLCSLVATAGGGCNDGWVPGALTRFRVAQPRPRDFSLHVGTLGVCGWFAYWDLFVFVIAFCIPPGDRAVRVIVGETALCPPSFPRAPILRAWPDLVAHSV